MAVNGSYSQKNVSLSFIEAIIYRGPQPTYITRISRAALKKELPKDFKLYEVTNGGKSVKIKGEGPYSKGRLFDIVRQAMLKRIKKRYSKLRTEVQAPLTIPTDFS